MSLQDRAAYWAQHYGVPEDLYASLVQQESGWNPNAVNQGSGAFGLTQAMPATAASPGFGVAPLARDAGADDQLRFGAHYFGEMMDRYDDPEKALAAYNWGPGNADKWNGDMSALPEETRDYITKIMGRRDGQQLAFPEDAAADTSPPPASPDMEVYGMGLMGDANRWRDNNRRAMQSRLGLNDKAAEGIGSALQQLGLQMMQG